MGFDLGPPILASEFDTVLLQIVRYYLLPYHLYVTMKYLIAKIVCN